MYDIEKRYDNQLSNTIKSKEEISKSIKVINPNINININIKDMDSDCNM